MPGASADIGHGITLTWASKVYSVISLEAPNLAADAPEKTHSLSPEKWREFIAGLKDAGEVTMEVNGDPDDIIAVGETGTLLVTFPVPAGRATGASFTCAAISTAFAISSPIDDRMTSTASWKLSGKPTFAGSGA